MGENNLTDDVKFDIFVPIDVSSSVYKTNQSDNVEKKWYIQGYASTPDLDAQGEIVEPNGINIDYFVKSGWINYEHKQDAEYVIGAPTENTYVDFSKGLFVEAVLFKENKYAKQMWDLANQISKNGINRNLGFSIEGAIRKRNDVESHIVEDVMITNVAITKNPANTEATWETFMKGLTTGHETNPEEQTDGAAIRREYLSDAVTKLTWVYNETKPEELKTLWKEVAEKLDYSERNDRESGTVLLQLSEGITRKEAEEFIDKHSK